MPGVRTAMPDVWDRPWHQPLPRPRQPRPSRTSRGYLLSTLTLPVFSKQRALSLPPHRPYDCAITAVGCGAAYPRSIAGNAHTGGKTPGTSLRTRDNMSRGLRLRARVETGLPRRTDADALPSAQAVLVAIHGTGRATPHHRLHRVRPRLVFTPSTSRVPSSPGTAPPSLVTHCLRLCGGPP